MRSFRRRRSEGSSSSRESGLDGWTSASSQPRVIRPGRTTATNERSNGSMGSRRLDSVPAGARRVGARGREAGAAPRSGPEGVRLPVPVRAGHQLQPAIE
jgi:hypothetical protein